MMYTISQIIEYFEFSSSISAQLWDQTIDGADLDDRGFCDVLPHSSLSLYISSEMMTMVCCSYRGLRYALFTSFARGQIIEDTLG